MGLCKPKFNFETAQLSYLYWLIQNRNKSVWLIAIYLGLVTLVYRHQFRRWNIVRAYQQ